MGGLAAKNSSRAMRQAGVIATQFRQDVISTEHLLLGLLENEENTACAIFRELSISIDLLKIEIERISPMGEGLSEKKPRPSLRAKKVIEKALEEGYSLGDGFIRTEYILLGLLREIDVPAAQVLNAHGLTLEKVRNNIREKMIASGRRRQ
jgi:ATP-dependent Clp protease ATP-binding subunit ClpC